MNEHVNRPPWELYSPAGLLELMAGDTAAAQFCIDIARCSHIYDDLIDRDKPVGEKKVHELMWALLFTIPLNPFFAAHQAAIRPVLMTAILNWQAANDIEADAITEELRVAHVLRYALADVVLLCMAITGGREHAMRHARRAALMGRADTWHHYLHEHTPMENNHAHSAST